MRMLSRRATLERHGSAPADAVAAPSTTARRTAASAVAGREPRDRARSVYDGATRFLSAVMVVLGVLLVVRGALLGVIVGVRWSRRRRADVGRVAAALAAMSYARLHGSATIGWTRLAAIIWTSLASSIYFSLGIVAGHALGLTPLVYLAAGLFFALTALTYLEGATLHPERAGSTVFARYAFNEIVSFIAAAAVLLDYVILIAICSLTAADYLATFVPAFGHGPPRVALALAIVAYVAATNVAGVSPLRHVRRVLAGVALDVVIQLLVIVIGLVLFFHLPTITDHIHLGSVPSWTGVIYALTITTVAFMSLESASGLSGELAVGRTGVRRITWGANLRSS